jgi:probable rRNA maturation factor
MRLENQYATTLRRRDLILSRNDLTIDLVSNSALKFKQIATTERRGKLAMIDLEIEYHVPSATKDDARFHQAAEWIADRFKLKSLTASISIVDDPTIHRLNREHLDHDWPTDVISFVFDNDNGNIDGEIIASIDTAARLAQQAAWPTADELLLYIIHGLLHLAGLDDITPEARHQMRQAEQDCLLGLSVPMAHNHLDRWDSISY